jgi:hypothetical protein
VWELDPADNSTTRILPPIDPKEKKSQDIQENGDEDSKAPDSDSNKIFSARYMPDRKNVIALRRTDEGEQLIMASTDLVTYKAGVTKIVTGDHISFDIDPIHNIVVYAVDRFHLPPVDPTTLPKQFLKDGKIHLGFTHLIGVFDPKDNKSYALPAGVIGTTPDDALGFDNVRVSPDGNSVMLVAGPYASGEVSGQGLLKVPLKIRGLDNAVPIVRGPGRVYQAEWNPNGAKIIFSMTGPSGKRDLFEIGQDGSGMKNLTNGQGNFSSPKYSPQTK